MGASRATLRLLAKRPGQSAKIHRLINRIREQARSHKNALAPAYLYQAKNTPCAFALVKLSQRCTQTCRSLLAKRPVQLAKIHRLNNRIREQARSHKNALAPAYLYQAKNTPCAFALVKLSQRCTQTCRSLLAKRPAQSAKIHRLINRIREQARSHKNAPDLHTCIKRRTRRVLCRAVRVAPVRLRVVDALDAQTCGSEPGDASLAREEASAIRKNSSPEP